MLSLGHRNIVESTKGRGKADNSYALFVPQSTGSKQVKGEMSGTTIDALENGLEV